MAEKTLAYLHWEKLVQKNDFQQADKFYEKLRKKKQTTAEICFVMGLWYRQKYQYEKAAEAFVQGLTQKPDSSDFYYELANTMREMGSDESAERYYRHCLALRPNYIDALYNLGQILSAAGRFGEAFECFCKAFNQAETVQEKIAIGVEVSAVDQPNEAIQMYFLALLQEPDNYYLYSNIGIEFAEMGDYENALFCHEKALKMDCTNADLWYNAACTYSLMDEVLRGLLALEKAIQYDNENRNYAIQDSELENLQKHKRFWQLVKSNPNRAEK